MKPKNIKQLQAQSRKLRARQIRRGTIAVESISDPSNTHTVSYQFGKDDTIYSGCTCSWAINRGVACSHVMAAMEYLAAHKNRTLSFWSSREEAERQKHKAFRLVGENDHDAIWVTSRAS